MGGSVNPLTQNVLKWSRTLEIMWRLLQDFYRVFDQIASLCIK